MSELWRYRQLLGALALRDLRVRYKQSVIGAAWALLQPLSTMVIFATLFHLLGRAPARSQAPYALVLLSALIPWQLCAFSLSQASESLVRHRDLLTKVYFPRVYLVLAPILTGLLDLLIATLLLFGLLVYYGYVPGLRVVLLPVFLVQALIFVAGAGLLLSALTVRYRDFRHVVPSLLQAGMLVTPVVYETHALIPPRWQPILACNPMLGVVEWYRWALIDGPGPSPLAALVSATSAVVFLGLGARHFGAVERSLADQV